MGKTCKKFDYVDNEANGEVRHVRICPMYAIAKMLDISRDKANEFVKQAESDPLGIDGLLKLDDPVLYKRLHPGNPAYTDERMEDMNARSSSIISLKGDSMRNKY